MIKHLIYLLVSITLLYLTLTGITRGIDNFRIPFVDEDVFGGHISSYKELLASGDELNNYLNEIKELNVTKMDSVKSKVLSEEKEFKNKRDIYEKLEANASEEEIAESNKKQEYLLDYLWIVVGNYANDNNVKFKMTTDEKNLRINFDVSGSYVSIINFIYDIENDDNLKFMLNGIKVATGSTDSTKASFSVDGVTVKTSNNT